MQARKRNRGERALAVVGVVYIAWALLAAWNAFTVDKAYDIFWLCYTGMLLIGIGLVLRNAILTQSQLLLLFIPDVVWTIDFASFAIFGTSLLGTSDYFFELPTFVAKLVSLQHLVTAPLALYVIRKQGVARKTTMLVSFSQAALFFLLSRLFTSGVHNINCVYRFCGDLALIGPYGAWWFVGILAMIVLTYWLFARGAHTSVTKHTHAQSRL